MRLLPDDKGVDCDDTPSPPTRSGLSLASTIRLPGTRASDDQ